MNLEKAKASYVSLLDSIDNSDDRDEFMKWVTDYYENCGKNNPCCINTEEDQNDAMKSQKRKADVLLDCIKKTLRDQLPLDATFGSEKIIFPTSGEDTNLNKTNCLHVDAFLYDEDDVDELLDAGKISNCYCSDCQSTNIEDITFISHSFSKKCAEYIFTNFLPPLDNKVVLDIGSRLGVILYSAHAYSSAREIIGVELSKEFCELQQNIISKFKMMDRCKVLQGDIMTMDDAVKKADVIILNEIKWFLSEKQQAKMWLFLRKNIKSGCTFVASPPIDDSLADLETNIVLKEWVKEIDPVNSVDCTEFIEDVHLKFYRIL